MAPIDIESPQEIEWPKWLLDTEPAFPAILNRLDLAEATIRSSLPKKLTYTRPFNRWLRSEEEKAIQTRNYSDGFLYGKLIENAEPLRLLDQVVYARSLAVTREAQTAKWLLNRNDLIGAMVMYRGILEQSANLASCFREVAKIDAAAPFDDTLRSHVLLIEFLKLRTHGTRIEWTKLFSLDPDEIFGTKGKDLIGYKPGEDRMDLTAKSVLGDIDKLDRELPGTRATYDILCEFLHPNVGGCIGVTGSAQPVPAAAGVGTPLVEKTLWAGPPVGFVLEGARFMSRLFEQFARTLEHYAGLLNQQPEARKACVALVQRINRQILTNNPSFKHPYLECPCGSGNKLRFCCSTTKAPEHN